MPKGVIICWFAVRVRAPPSFLADAGNTTTGNRQGGMNEFLGVGFAIAAAYCLSLLPVALLALAVPYAVLRLKAEGAGRSAAWCEGRVSVFLQRGPARLSRRSDDRGGRLDDPRAADTRSDRHFDRPHDAGEPRGGRLQHRPADRAGDDPQRRGRRPPRMPCSCRRRASPIGNACGGSSSGGGWRFTASS